MATTQIHIHDPRQCRLIIAGGSLVIPSKMEIARHDELLANNDILSRLEFNTEWHVNLATEIMHEAGARCAIGCADGRIKGLVLSSTIDLLENAWLVIATVRGQSQGPPELVPLLPDWHNKPGDYLDHFADPHWHRIFADRLDDLGLDGQAQRNWADWLETHILPPQPPATMP